MKPSQKIKQNVVNQIAKTTLYENVSELMKMQQIYEAGIKEIRTKLEILDAEFKVKHDHNPIHHIESRLKSPESILKKAINSKFILLLITLIAYCKNSYPKVAPTFIKIIVSLLSFEKFLSK